MGKFVFILFVALLVAGFVWFAIAIQPPTYGTVLEVRDGASFIMKRGGNNPFHVADLYIVTLSGIIPDPLDIGNGKEAKKYLESLILDKKVGIQIKDHTSDQFTNSILAETVYVVSDKDQLPEFNVGVRILQEGYARYMGSPYSDAENLAKSQLKGIWATKK
jgi:hypothetical protein